MSGEGMLSACGARLDAGADDAFAAGREAERGATVAFLESYAARARGSDRELAVTVEALAQSIRTGLADAGPDQGETL